MLVPAANHAEVWRRLFQRSAVQHGTIGINSEFVTVIDGGTSIHNRRPCASSRRAESVIRNRAKLPALTVLALGIAACQGGSGELTVEDLAVIRQVTRAWQFHVGVADWESLMVVYTSNAVFMPPNGPTLHGHDAIRTFMAEGPAITQVSLTIEEIDGGGNLAFVRGTYTMTLQPEGAPEPVQDRGKYVQIRRKQADGAWLIAVDIFNSDLPIPQ